MDDWKEKEVDYRLAKMVLFTLRETGQVTEETEREMTEKIKEAWMPLIGSIECELK